MEVDGDGDGDGLGLETRVFFQRENVRVEWVGGLTMSRFSKLYRNVGIFQNRFSNVGILPNYPIKILTGFKKNSETVPVIKICKTL